MSTPSQLEEQAATLDLPLTSQTWLNVVAHLDPRFGGISAVLPSFCGAVNATGRQTATLTPFCLPDEQFNTPAGLPVAKFPLGMKRWLTDRRIRERLRRMVEEASGVHIHGLWQEHDLFAAAFARAAQKPYVVSAHGMLERWALANKRLKKQIYAGLIERKSIGQASCLHALTRAEVADYRNFGATNPIAIIPNGVITPAVSDAEQFLERFPMLRGKQIVLFLGRIHFKKGMDVLCRAWRKADKPADAQLVLAGPDFEGTRARVEVLISELGIGNSVTFTGMLSGDDKWSALAAAQVFVLPSHSEGLSTSVLEAMAMQTPVIVSEQCNVPEAKEAGWLILPEEEQLATAFQEFFETSTQERRQAGDRGRLIVNRKYNWNSIGQQMSSLYGWLEGGAMPSNVELVRC
jgi:glycosyltransferase involved in cell wall biosynthesis